MILVPFIILFALFGYLSIHAPITCILHDLSALGVTQHI